MSIASPYNMNQNKYESPPVQWNSTPQSYQDAPVNTHSQNGYSSPMPPVHSQTSTSPTFNNTSGTQSQSQPLQPQYTAYYNTSSNYPPGSPGSQQMYSSMSPNMSMNYTQPYHSQTISHPQSPVAQNGYPSQGYSYSQSSNLAIARPYPQGYRIPDNELMEESRPHRTEIPQTIGISSDYPSPVRPYSCDLCALSFNRQHDLKRHRETHTGEKPHLCNGGCGKTFTRKDALKRHQLVKSCGKFEDTWS